MAAIGSNTSGTAKTNHRTKQLITTMETAHYYEVDIQWKMDRKGILSSAVLDATIEIATPPQFAKGIPGIWSPEHLLVAAVNSCLMTTFLAIAENSKLNFEGFTSGASGKLEMVDGKYMISEITLKPVLSIGNEEDREKANRILTKSEAACLISNSVKSKILFEPTITVVSTSLNSITMKLFQSLILAITILTVASCTQAQNNNSIAAKPFATAIAEKPGITLLDVRTPEEYAEGHIKGAKNIDWKGDSFSTEVAALDKKQPVYVYCHSGKRSAQAAKQMRKDGFEKVYELEGGMNSWEEAGQPVE
jgi:peroxiredoxin-like protein